ncbi:hypothetical protein [Pelagicoccus mobilis]|uniref:Uncharacterized protein n=1 Tax=Pelagicoccus mobilis TaxID=415221 RepID=A0A934RXV7_9BACT|nr:hypothetical protein [Pelagicoccus mobilis]MBK1877244.1 hypothetical protein [Pelagicoccus mobilis]
MDIDGEGNGCFQSRVVLSFASSKSEAFVFQFLKENHVDFIRLNIEGCQSEHRNGVDGRYVTDLEAEIIRLRQALAECRMDYHAQKAVNLMNWSGNTKVTERFQKEC